MQYHPFTAVLHVDLQRVDARTRLHKKVPLHFVNADQSPAVKEDKCLVNTPMTVIEIECLATALPEFITVDLANMTKGSSIHVKDLVLPVGIKVVTHGRPNQTVVSMVEPEPEVTSHQWPKWTTRKRARARSNWPCSRSASRRRLAVCTFKGPPARAFFLGTPSMIKLLVGLGNPGPDYEATRHNAGFWWIDALAAQLGTQLVMERGYFGRVARTMLDGQTVWLLQPQTFMNKSGQSVAALARFYKIDAAEILVIHDELDLPPGECKLKQGGSHAGHNGLRDIHGPTGHRRLLALAAGYWPPWAQGRGGELGPETQRR